MALANMGVKRIVVNADPEILYNSHYTGNALTLDTTAFTDGVCKAGNPISAKGVIANSSSAVGILLHDVYEERPQATIVIGGYIHTARAQEHSGVTISADAKAAMKNVVFC